MTVRVDVQFASDDQSALASDDIATWVNRAIDASGRRGDREVLVRVVDVSEMQQLNNDFRGQDSPTNVLSFPAAELDGLPDTEDLPLGDIVVCAAVVATEAARQGKTLRDHWAHMIVHGSLHLLGFDHESAGDAAEMEGMEIQIMTQHGIANPYTDSLID